MSSEQLPKEYEGTMIGRFIGLLKCIGITFFEESKGVSIKSVAKLTLFCLNLFPFIMSQFRLIGDIRADNFLETVKVVPLSILYVSCIIKLLIGLFKKKEIRDVLLEIGELWPKNLHTLDEKSIIKERWLWKMNILLNSFFIYAIVNLVLFETVPLLGTIYYMIIGERVYLLPFQISGLWTVDSALKFLLTYVWQVSATVSCHVCISMPFDLIIVTLTSDISVLFRLLQVDVVNVIRTREHGKALLNQNLSDLDSYDALRDIIRKHQKLLKISGKITEIFGIIIFIHFAFSAVIICFFGFLTVVYGGIAETIINLLTLVNPVLIIFILALSGQLLSDTSSNVADAAYHCLWYESDIRFKRLVLIIIARSQNPCYLSALGFSDITLRSFSKIMSSSWTYFSLLIQLYKED